MMPRRVAVVFGFLVAVSLLESIHGLDDNDSCRTPRNEEGECKVVTQCAVLYSILEHRPIKSGDVDYLKKSQCGFAGKFPKVCCPLSGSSSKPSTTTQRPQGKIDNSYLLPGTDICGVDTQDRIYGGETAGLQDYPWMALIEYERDNGKTGFYCGGVLINARYILTAAHCLKGKDLPKSWKLISVRLGEYNVDTDTDCVNNGFKEVCAPPPVNVLVEERIAHENYDPFDTNQLNDIALLRLAKNVTYSGYVKPVCLPKTNLLRSKNHSGDKLTVAGWGKTETRSESAVKLKLQVPVKNNAECTTTYKAADVNLDDDGQMCAGGEKGKDSCRGDSGGPLMSLQPDENNEINWYSVGVVSFGPSPCGMENWPGVYTRVANYIPWITSKLRP